MSYRFEANFSPEELNILADAIELYGNRKLMGELNESIRNQNEYLKKKMDNLSKRGKYSR